MREPEGGSNLVWMLAIAALTIERYLSSMVRMPELDQETYKRQTLVVESLLDYHPEFAPSQDPSFSTEEARLFEELFQPNWGDFNDDYVQAFEHLSKHRRSDMQRAQEILRKWCLAHGIDPKEVGL